MSTADKRPWRLSHQDKKRMREMRAAGYSLREVAREFGCSPQNVRQSCEALPLDVEYEIVSRRHRESLAKRGDLWTAEEDVILRDAWRRWRSAAKIRDSGVLKRSWWAIYSRVDVLGLRHEVAKPLRSSGVSLPFVSILARQPENAA